MISAGLIPENELTEQVGIEISKGTHGAVVTEDLQTSAKGFFACGNVLHVHDLVDFVATEAEGRRPCCKVCSGGYRRCRRNDYRRKWRWCRCGLPADDP